MNRSKGPGLDYITQINLAAMPQCTGDSFGSIRAIVSCESSGAGLNHFVGKKNFSIQLQINLKEDIILRPADASLRVVILK